MPDVHYFAAMQAALAILDAEVTAPDLPRHQKLAGATFLILRAMREVEATPAANAAPAACWCGLLDQEMVFLN